MALTIGELGGGGGRSAGSWLPKNVNRVNTPQKQVSVPATAPAPVWTPPQISSTPSYYQAPYVPPQAENPYYGNNFSQGSAGGSSSPAPAPVAKRLTADDFAKQYKNNDKGLAITDSTFADQQSQYAKVLKDYMADYDRQSKDLTDETKVARDGIGRNREIGMTNQAEDMFARGLGNSGLFSQEQDKARDAYARQDTNVADSRTRQQGDLDFRKNKFQGENGASGSNIQAARREAYNRLALKQQL